MNLVVKAGPAIYRQHNKNLKTDQEGFSLVEMLLVILLIFTIVALVSSLLISTDNTSRDIISIVKSEIDARLAIYRISKDIRETHNIISADDYEVIFESNIDSDEYYERVRYYLVPDGSNYDLYRQIDSGSSDLFIKNIVDDSIFTYYSGLSTPEAGMIVPISDEEILKTIKYVNITVNIDQSGTSSPRTMTLDTIITLRNRIY
jgi:type II secretory pathway pseudopilin PulG